jgi:hypothetical protein
VQEKLRIKSEHLHNKVLKRNYIFTYGGMLTEGNLSLSDPFKFVNLNNRCVHRKLDHTQAVQITISQRLYIPYQPRPGSNKNACTKLLFR